MIDDRIWKLIAKKLSGEASPEELQELEKLVKDNPGLHHSIEAFTKFWESPVKQTANPDPSKLWERIRAQHMPIKLPKAPALFSVKRNFRSVCIYINTCR